MGVASGGVTQDVPSLGFVGSQLPYEESTHGHVDSESFEPFLFRLVRIYFVNVMTDTEVVSKEPQGDSSEPSQALLGVADPVAL